MSDKLSRKFWNTSSKYVSVPHSRQKHFTMRNVNILGTYHRKEAYTTSDTHDKKIVWMQYCWTQNGQNDFQNV